MRHSVMVHDLIDDICFTLHVLYICAISSYNLQAPSPSL